MKHTLFPRGGFSLSLVCNYVVYIYPGLFLYLLPRPPLPPRLPLGTDYFDTDHHRNPFATGCTCELTAHRGLRASHCIHTQSDCDSGL